MKSAWNDAEAKKLGNDLLKLRVYTSRLLGQDPDLVLHGGGNTSVKIVDKNIFGEDEEILYVKGSGWDLATIEEPGFAPVKIEFIEGFFSHSSPHLVVFPGTGRCLPTTAHTVLVWLHPGPSCGAGSCI